MVEGMQGMYWRYTQRILCQQPELRTTTNPKWPKVTNTLNVSKRKQLKEQHC